MMIKTVFQGAKTDEEFREKLGARQKITGLAAAMGATGIICGILMVCLLPDTRQNAFMSGVYCGVGAAAVVMGIMELRKIRKMLKDSTILRRERIKEGDERSAEIGRMASGRAALIFLFAMMFALLIAGFFSMEVFWTLWCSVLGYSVICKLSEIYYRKKI